MAQLGDKVKCRVTGFYGVVTSRTVFLNGCVQVGIQGPLSKEGKMGESWNIDESQIDVIVIRNVPVKAKKTGGPMKQMG